MRTTIALVAAFLLLAGCAGEKSGSDNQSAPVKGGNGQIVDVGDSIPAQSGSGEISKGEDSITLNDTDPSEGEVSSGGSVGFGK